MAELSNIYGFNVQFIYIPGYIYRETCRMKKLNFNFNI